MYAFVSSAPGATSTSEATSADPESGPPCRTVDPDWFFSEYPAVLERAKEICVGCSVRQVCLAQAIAREEPWGVWGGQLLQNGVVIASKRARGRPRKVVTVALLAQQVGDIVADRRAGCAA